MYTSNKFIHMMTNVGAGTTVLHVKHLSITCIDNCTGHIINYIHIENNFLSNSVNLRNT